MLLLVHYYATDCPRVPDVFVVYLIKNICCPDRLIKLFQFMWNHSNQRASHSNLENVQQNAMDYLLEIQIALYSAWIYRCMTPRPEHGPEWRKGCSVFWRHACQWCACAHSMLMQTSADADKCNQSKARTGSAFLWLNFALINLAKIVTRSLGRQGDGKHTFNIII